MISVTLPTVEITRLDLAGIWQLSGAGRTVPAELPGDNYTALWKAGVIPTPYLGANEEPVQWIALWCGGNSRIIEMFTRCFRFPKGEETVIYLSQVQQALAIKPAVEFWRTLKPHCRGVLYWQFNDNWPVASWSGIDYYGDWKQLHYHAKRFYAPVIATVFRRPGGAIELHAVSDLPLPFRGEAECRYLPFDGDGGKSYRFEAVLAPGEAKKLAELPEEEPAAGFYHFELTGDGHRHTGEFFLTEYKRCELPKAKLRAEVLAKGIKLHTDRPAFFVFAELPETGAVWSDNSFTLLPDRPVTLRCRPERPLTQTELAAQLRITQLSDTW